MSRKIGHALKVVALWVAGAVVSLLGGAYLMAAIVGLV